MFLADTAWGLLSATIVLALATGALVWATWALVGEQRLTRQVMETHVGEAREARSLTVRPRLALDIEMVDPRIGEVAVKNLGRGSGFEVDLVIGFDPMGERRPWRAPTFAPGEVHRFHLPKDILMSGMPAAAEAGVTISVSGSYSDLYGERLAIDDVLEVAPWWERVSEAGELFRRKPVVEALEKIAKALRKPGGV